jgi:hypothetical protein
MTVARRPTPFDLVFGQVAEERFPLLREGIEAAGRNPRDRDSFLLVREVGEFLRELRPEEGLGVAVSGLVGLVHHAFLFWLDGAQVTAVDEAELRGVVDQPSPAVSPPSGQGSRYVQLPSLRIWGVPIDEGPAEPLDGWFVRREAEQLALLAVFGLHPGRDGLTAVEMAGRRPVLLQRLDGSPLFSSVLSGGMSADLASVVGEEELLELAWRVEESS